MKQKEPLLNNSIVPDLLCFSHLRWDFVYQRPQHIMSRLNKSFRIFYIEEPLFHNGTDEFKLQTTEDGVITVTPFLNEEDRTAYSITQRQKSLLTKLMVQNKIVNYYSWYYTPMALKISQHLNPSMIIYDCMDELSAFKFAPAELKLLETELLKTADLVFTGGQSLFEAKKHQHKNIFPFPSSIDKAHFGMARKFKKEPADQEKIKGTKIGFYGVIDERFDIQLIEEVATKRPDWQFIMIGPIVKIDPADLPKNPNVHFLGGKTYKELPQYLSGWDIAIIPFANNESTKFISPTKTPEYLAGGKPVISSSIKDVVTPYGDKGLVHIADNAQEFIKAAEKELNKDQKAYALWLEKADAFLKNISWNQCVSDMISHIDKTFIKDGENSSLAGRKSVA